MKKTHALQTIKIYWQHTKKYKRQLLTVYPAMVVAQVIEDFVQPLVISFILTNLSTNNIDHLKNSNLPLILGAIVATELIGHLLWNKVVIPIFWRTQDLIMKDLNMAAFNHLQTMDVSFFNDRFAGSLVNQVNKFVGSFERLTDALTWNVFKLLVSLIATTIILAPKAPAISISLLIITAIYTPIIWVYRKRQLPYNQAWAASETERTGQLADSISNITAVKSYAGEKLEQIRMQEKVDAVHHQSIRTMQLTMKQEFITGGIQRSINISVIIISVILAIRGNISVGIIYLALSFAVAIMRRLWDLNNTFRTFTRVFGDAHDMTEILQMEPIIKDALKPQKTIIKRGSIIFEDVKFTHNEADKPLFDNFNLKIKQGEKIGLVGHSGSGKTSLTKLLLRFSDIDSGQILIDGQDIKEIAQRHLRSHIAYVPQEPLLFHRTLAENIAYGSRDASQQEIEGVAKMAHAHDFISKLPDGYNTLVGERGVKLSGGQRQRVAIARAMLKNAPILLLDEATSALDSESENLIQDALWKLMQNRTAIVIAHRLSTIQKMDRIVVLDEGEIVEQGTHKELIRLNGTYAKLWGHQSGGFLDD
jgi:ATP-binding cassette subfamily B protein